MKEIMILLDNKNIKKTSQRLIILNIIKDHGHATIENIKEDLNKSNPTISIATIYKNINFLLNEKILKRVPTQSNEFFEITKKEHYHAIRKGKLVDCFYKEEDLERIRNILKIDKNEKISLIIE